MDRSTSDYPTGLWLEEFAVRYLVFRDTGDEFNLDKPEALIRRVRD